MDQALVWCGGWCGLPIPYCSHIAVIVHFLAVIRIKSLRTPNKSGLWLVVNGWLGLASSSTLREWVQGVLCPWGLGIGFPIRQTRTTQNPMYAQLGLAGTVLDKLNKYWLAPGWVWDGQYK